MATEGLARVRFDRHTVNRDRVGGRGKGCGWGRIVGPDREREEKREREGERSPSHGMVVGASGAGRGWWRTPGQCVEGTSHGEG